MNAAQLKKLGWTRDDGKWPYYTGVGPKWTHRDGAVIQGYATTERSSRRGLRKVHVFRLSLAATQDGRQRTVYGQFDLLGQAVKWHQEHEIAGIPPRPGVVYIGKCVNV